MEYDAEFEIKINKASIDDNISKEQLTNLVSHLKTIYLIVKRILLKLKNMKAC